MARVISWLEEYHLNGLSLLIAEIYFNSVDLYVIDIYVDLKVLVHKIVKNFQELF